MIVDPRRIGMPLFWSAASSLSTQILSFLTFAVLARLLGAPAFGLVALAALVIDLLLVVSNAGINEAVIQRRELTEEDADTAFWANLACGLLFCLAVAAIAPVVSQVFRQPALTPIIRALALIFVITPLGAIHTARLARDLQFRAIASRNVAAALAGAAIGLPLAFAGYGIWALAGQRIAAALAMALSPWFSTRWLPKLRFRRDTCKQMLRFGCYIGLSSTLNQFNIRSAEIVSGALAGPAAVAFIRAGSRIVEVLNQITYMPFQQIAMPVLARSSHDREAIRATYLRLSRLSSFIMFPAFLGCFALAPQIVALVFGAGWEQVADALRIFACAVFASQMNNLIVAAITAVGESRTVLSWTATQIFAGCIAAAAVHDLGWQAMLITGVARGYLILPYGFHLLYRHVGIGFREVFRSLRPAITSTVFMVCLVLAGTNACHGLLPDLLVVALWLPAGALAYLAAYIWQDREIVDQVRAMIWNRTAGLPN